MLLLKVFYLLSYQSALGVTEKHELYTLLSCGRYAVSLLKKLCPDKGSKFSLSKLTCAKAERYFKQEKS